MKKLLALVGILAFFVLAQHYQVTEVLSLENIKAHQQDFEASVRNHFLQSVLIYVGIYILTTALSIPGAGVLTLLGGALFGVFWGTVIVSFASTTGATLAFLTARFFLRDWVQASFGDRLKLINEGIKKEGAFYLFALRLVPLFPFFIVNLLMGLTPMKIWTYFWVSQLGMLLGTLVYVNAGTQLAQIDSLAALLSVDLALSFSLLGLFPFGAKMILQKIKNKKIYAHYKKPQHFDYNVVVIGAGAGGLVSSYIAAAVKARVALVEKDKMGGDCLNTGCVPSKALIKTAKVLKNLRNHKKYGISEAQAKVDFSQVMSRVHTIIGAIEPHDSVERYTGLGVQCISGEAHVVSPWEVKVGDQTLTTKSIILATGARPFVPPIPGIEKVTFLTSDSLWSLKELPKKLLVLGGGPIGCELTQAFARLGSQVTQVDLAPRIMPREDEDVSTFIRTQLESEGVRVLTQHQALRFDSPHSLTCDHQGQEVALDFDEILIAVGRQARVEGFGLEELGVELTPRKTIEADPYLRTNFPNIFVVGDAVGPYQFTHTAAHTAYYAATNALFGSFQKVNWEVVPWCTYTDPEVARVGLSESEAQSANIPHEVHRYPLDDLDRAITESETQGWVKVLVKPGSDKILGATIVGYHAGDIIAEFVLAMKHGLGLNKIMGTIHIYPTLSEANKFVAGVWKKAHAPEKWLKRLEKFHRWRRS